MKITPELAEICGMFAADGCMQKGYICMWGNITEDKEYYDSYLAPLFTRIFNKKVNVHEKKSNGVYGFYLCSREIVKSFNKAFNFPIGKKTYTVEVPKIILKSKDPKIYASFIRGFTDCDGYINFGRRDKRYNEFERKFHFYPRVAMTSVSKSIIDQLSYMLKKLHIKHTVHKQRKFWKNKVNPFIIVIRGKERLKRWMKVIGFKNPAQLTKYQIWKKFGFCPPYTSILDRQKVLKGQINPILLYGSVAKSGNAFACRARD